MTENQPQTIEALTERYRELSELQIRTQADLENAQKNLEALERDAVEQFGTSDLDELSQKLEKMEAENELRLKEYQKHLDQIETELQNVEQAYAEEKQQ